MYNINIVLINATNELKIHSTGLPTLVCLHYCKPTIGKNNKRQITYFSFESLPIVTTVYGKIASEYNS